METPKVTINKIQETKSDEVMQLELQQETNRPASANKLGFLMQGHSKFAPQVDKRFCWPSVSTKQVKSLGLEEGLDFNQALAKQGLKARLRIVEAVNKTYDAAGNERSDEEREQYDQPKINPSTDEVLTKDGQNIYRSTVLDIVEKNAEFTADTFVQHDNVSSNVEVTQEESSEIQA